jgi:hypothetical protein
MAVNANALNPRLADRKLFLITAIGFPLLVLIGYFRSYYFRPFFMDRPLATSLVHLHGIVMSLWVLYFVAQVVLIRTKNIKLHMTMGFAGIALAAIVVVVGMAAAVDAHLIRGNAPAGLDPHAFFLIPTMDMLMFVILLGGAIYYRKRPTEHKSLMFLTVINFLPAAVGRIPVVPSEFMILWTFGVPMLMMLTALGRHTWKHRKFNWVFTLGVLLLLISIPVRIFFAGSATWLSFADWLASHLK